MSKSSLVLERREYLVDHFRVSFEGGGAWHCPCREFSEAGECRHTREAGGMREAQVQIARQLKKSPWTPYVRQRTERWIETERTYRDSASGAGPSIPAAPSDPGPSRRSVSRLTTR